MSAQLLQIQLRAFKHLPTLGFKLAGVFVAVHNICAAALADKRPLIVGNRRRPRTLIIENT